MSQEFVFKHYLTTVSVTLEAPLLSVKQGFRTRNIEFDRLKYLYVVEYEGIGKEVIIAYEESFGSLKRVRLTADFGELGFHNFVDELARQIPAIDIRHMPAAEALKMMGAVNPVKLALPLVFLLEMALLTLFFFPSLIRGINTSAQTIGVDKLSQKGLITTSHLTVSDPYLLYDYSIEETITDEESDETTVRYYIPVVGEDWTEEEPVHMVMQTPELSDDEFAELVVATAIPGVLRNILWEGLSSDNKAYFKTELNINLAPDVLLLEYKADTKTEFTIALVVIGLAAILSLIALFITGRVMLKQFKK